MATITEIQEKMATSFEQAFHLFEQVDPSAEIYAGWTIKELIAHLIGWDKASSDSLSSYVQGGTPAVVALEGTDKYNQESVRKYASMPLVDLVQKWEYERGHLIDILNALKDTQLEDQIAHPWGGKHSILRMLLGLTEHERAHSADVEKIIHG